MANQPSFQSWWKILESVKTPLSLLGLIVLVVSTVLTFTITRLTGIPQIILIFGSLFLLFAVVVVVTTRSFRKQSRFPEEIPSIWSSEDLPISESEKACWLGKWNCRWTYRTKKRELKPYVDDVVNIETIDTETGKFTGTAISAYGEGVTYKIVGRISNKRIAHIFYSSPPPRSGLSGMAILRRPPIGDMDGWWLGVSRDGGDIGGGVSWSRSQTGDSFQVRFYPVEEP